MELISSDPFGHKKYSLFPWIASRAMWKNININLYYKKRQPTLCNDEGWINFPTLIMNHGNSCLPTGNSMFSFGPHIWLLKAISSKGPRAAWLELLCRREPAKVPPAETPCLSHSDDILISVTPELIRGTEMLIDQNLARNRCKDCGCSLKCLRFLWYC